MKKKKMMANIWDSSEMNSFPWLNLSSKPEKNELAFCQTPWFCNSLQINNKVLVQWDHVSKVWEQFIYCDLTSHFEEK